MRCYERASTLLTSNRPVEDWGKLLGDVAAVSSMLDRILHHGHVLKCGSRSWRTKTTQASQKLQLTNPVAPSSRDLPATRSDRSRHC
jgi:DNA replication protein DnaC